MDSPLDTCLRQLRERHATPQTEVYSARRAQSLSERAAAPFGLNREQEEAIAEALRATYYQKLSPEAMASTEGEQDCRWHTVSRYWDAVTCMLPWIQGAVDLEGARVVEIGSGTGSSAAAWGQRAARVDAFEICSVSSEAARRRFDIMGLDTVQVHVVEPVRSFDQIEEVVAQGPPVDLLVLFAVLEHMTIDERLTALIRGVKLLRPGGVLLIGETPNRLTWFDGHTAQLPFFHMLPDELALLLVEQTGRRALIESVAEARSHSIESALLQRVRWGTGVSYHEFEAAFGASVHGTVIRSGYEPEIQALCPISVEEALLAAYCRQLELPVHEAFYRNHLYMLLQKPGGG